jgi:glycosyltransferase involved in cell wall biosynthesis
MPKISVAIITKNEEENIRECLESVQWADEIVVVDGGSTDRTRDICREFEARVFEEEWKGFARQKNSAVDKTRNEWVLSLDADERISPELQKEIQERFPGRRFLYGPEKLFLPPLDSLLRLVP